MRRFTTVREQRIAWVLFALAALSFLPTLGFYYVGEEGVYTISSLEMWYRGQFLVPVLYGGEYGRPPFLNWLVIPLANLLGWDAMLVASRLVAVCSTILSACVLFWLARRVFRGGAFAVFTALGYLTLGDLLMYRGWLAYADPLFALLVFAALACLWVAAEEHRPALLAISLLAAFCAFLTKALTAYVFYATAFAVLLARREARAFLLRVPALGLYACAIAAPLLWFAWVPGNQGQSGAMLRDILNKLSSEGFAEYAGRLLYFPTSTLLRSAPLALLVLYFFLRGRVRQPETEPERFLTGLWIALLGYLPYWLSPQGGIRYVLPLYPLGALVLTRLLWRTDERAIRASLGWFAAAIGLKFVFVLGLFPFYQSHYRGENYAQTARQIMARTDGQPLYTTDTSASGLSVAAYIDSQRYPAAPLIYAPADWDSGFVLAYTADERLGAVVERYPLGGNEIYLLCRGEACSR